LTPIQAELHASAQGSKVISLGREIRVPILISSIVFNEVMTMITKGKRKYRTAMPSRV
jgi:hypothetical protein